MINNLLFFNNMTITIEDGKEHHVSSSSLVSINGKLPYYQELRTSILLNVLITFSEKKGKNIRHKINQWLFSRTRPGFYLELNNHLLLVMPKEYRCLWFFSN